MSSVRASQCRSPASLSDSELHSELEKYGETSSPLTPSTRSIFERQLARLWKFTPRGDSDCAKSRSDMLNDYELNKSHRTEHLANNDVAKPNIESSAEASNSQIESSVSQVYFGVSLLSCSSSCSEDDEPPLVFTDKKEALRVMKKYKGARFKAFSNREEAVAFASQSPESMTSSPAPKSPGISLPLNSPEPNGSSGIVGEKPSPFKAPKSQDSVKLRKAIECGDAEYFKETVWANPRYLISSGDTPAVLQEGFRYNALHVAAKCKQPIMCSLILDTIEDPKFMQLLYVEDTEEIRQQRISFLTDLYLNMPDKGLCETPLHFASKFGCAKVVEILASHPSCIKNRTNKYGQKPNEIICDRCPGATTELKMQIETIFEERCYVPVLRAENNSSQPVIGEPWSPSKDKSAVPGSPSTPLSPKEPTLAIQALAGPMTPKQAKLFYYQWKTPPRSFLPSTEARKIRLSDPEKGLERIGRDLAQNFKVQWKEYWSFLDSWCDLSSSEGLLKLENHLRKVYTQLKSQITPEVIEEKIWDHNQSSSVESSVVQDSSNISSVENVSYHASDDSSLSPISDLCQRLENFHTVSSSSSSKSAARSGSTLYRNFFQDCLDDVARTLKFEPSPLKNVTSENRTRSLEKGKSNSEKKLSTMFETYSKSTCEIGETAESNVENEKHDASKQYTSADMQNNSTGLKEKNASKSRRSSEKEVDAKQNVLDEFQSSSSSLREKAKSTGAEDGEKAESTGAEDGEKAKRTGAEDGEKEAETRQNLSNLNILCNTVVHSLSTILSDMVISFPDFVTHERMTHKYLKDNVLSCICFLQVAVSEHAFNDVACVGTIHDTIAKQVLASLKDILTPHELKLVYRGLSSYLNIYYDITSSEEEEEEYHRQRQKPVTRRDVAASKWQHLRCIVRCVCDHLAHQEHSEEKTCFCLWPFQQNIISSPLLSFSHKNFGKETLTTTQRCLQKFSDADVNNFHKGEMVQDCNSNITPKVETVLEKTMYSNNKMKINDGYPISESQKDTLSPLLEDSDIKEDDVFYTPPSSVCSSSSNPEEIGTPDEGLQVFIVGTEPSKLDMDVFRAIRNANVDEILYPHVCRWKHLISTFRGETTESWQSPSGKSLNKHSLQSSKNVLPSPVSVPPTVPENTSTPQDVDPSRKESASLHYHSGIVNPKNLYESFLGWEESSGE